MTFNLKSGYRHGLLTIIFMRLLFTLFDNVNLATGGEAQWTVYLRNFYCRIGLQILQLIYTDILNQMKYSADVHCKPGVVNNLKHN